MKLDLERVFYKHNTAVILSVNFSVPFILLLVTRLVEEID
jgi:hypothetical protein